LTRGSDLEAEVEKHLREAKVKYVKQPVVLAGTQNRPGRGTSKPAI